MKAVLTFLWLVYAVLLAALAIERDTSLLIMVGFWTFGLLWITLNFLYGVRVQRGRSVGGGVMYPRVALDPSEELTFNAPSFVGLIGGHLFITTQRIIMLPLRYIPFVGSAGIVPLGAVTSFESQAQGVGWPLPRQSVRIVHDGHTLVLRPWSGPGPRLFLDFMGVMPADEFVQDVLSALSGRGVPQSNGHESP